MLLVMSELLIVMFGSCYVVVVNEDWTDMLQYISLNVILKVARDLQLLMG